MIASDIAKRYARALFEITREDNSFRKTHEELNTLSSMLEENDNLKEFFENPIFDQSDKKAVVEQLLGKVDVSLTTSNFLKLLVDKRRMDLLTEIEQCYRELIDGALNKLRVEVRTAFGLSDELTGEIGKHLAELTGKNIEMIVNEDPALLGGIVVGIGDTIYDGSIRAQLKSMRELIREETK